MTRNAATWRAEGACLLALLGFALAAAAPVLAGGVPIAADALALWGPQATVAPQPVHNAALADSALLYLPWQVFIRRSLAGGEWPLWNPDQFAGYPFQGNPQTGLYYPVAWLRWLLPLPLALQASTVFHLWLAGAAMFVLARVLGTSRTGSVLAGLAFAGSSGLLLVLDIPGLVDIYGWLPLVLAAGEIAWRRASWRWAAGAGLLFGILALAGHLQWFLYSGMFLAAWFAARLSGALWDMSQQRQAGAGQHLWGQVLRAGAILAWGPALAAVQLLPFAELAGYASRTTTAGLTLPAPALDRTLRLLGRQLTAFVPRIDGTPVGNIGAPLNSLSCWYVGLAPLALALLALIVCRERRVWFLGAAGLAAFAVAANLPFFNLLHQLPGLQALLPQRMAYLFLFCAAALSGRGFDGALALARRRPGFAAGILAALLCLALPVVAALLERHQASSGKPDLYALQTAALGQAGILALALVGWGVALIALRGDRHPRGRAILAGALLGLTTLDLLTYAPDYNTYVAPAALAPQTGAAAFMRADPLPGRMLAPDSPGPLFVPNSATLYDLQDVAGYDSLHLGRYEAFWAAADPSLRSPTIFNYFNASFRPQVYTATQAALLNVQYIPMGAPLTAGVHALQPGYDNDIFVYTNTAALPRAFTVAGAEVLPAPAILARLSAPGFDPRRAVLLEQPLPPGAAPPGDPSPPGAATITRYRNLSVDVTATMERPGWLVLGDVNYPGWSVTVDGRPAPLYTADYILRAVPLAAGAHQVHFYFLPLSVLLGGAVSGAALLIAAGVLAGARRKRGAAAG